MHSIQDTIVSFLLLSMILFTLVILVEFNLPLNTKKNADMKLDYYTSVMERESGLSNSQITEIKSYLTKLKFKDIKTKITKVNERKYTQDLVLEVKAKLNVKTPIALFERQNKTIDYVYREVIPNNRVMN